MGTALSADWRRPCNAEITIAPFWRRRNTEDCSTLGPHGRYVCSTMLRCLHAVILLTLTATTTADAQSVNHLSVPLADGVEMAFVRIGPGATTLGMTASHKSRLEAILSGPFITDTRATPATPAVIEAGFYLGRTEMTRRQWRAVLPVAEQPPDSDDLPVSGVGFDDARRLLDRLNRQDFGGTFRLPTDAEWEYTARAGAETLWYFGDRVSDLSDHAHYKGLSAPQPVGTRLPNPWGLFDMHGNVEEWTADSWTSEGPYSSCAGVARGGSYLAGAGHGYLATLPFMRQPRACSDFTEDLSGTGLRLVFEPDTATALNRKNWAGIKRLRP